jgi:hypothetical protein
MHANPSNLERFAEITRNCESYILSLDEWNARYIAGNPPETINPETLRRLERVECALRDAFYAAESVH